MILAVSTAGKVGFAGISLQKILVRGTAEKHAPHRASLWCGVKAHELNDTCCFDGWESRVRRHTKALAIFISFMAFWLYNLS